LNYAKQVQLKGTFIGIDASAFYTYFTNKIVGDFLTDPGKIIYDNLTGYAVSKGFTLNMDASIYHRFKINAGVTIMDVYQMEKDSLGQQIKVPQLFAPKFSGTYAVSYSMPKQGISIDWTGRVNGPMYLPVFPNDFRPEKSPLYCIMNLQVTKTFKAIELYGGLKNILNFLPKNPLLHPDDPFNRPGGKYFDLNGNARLDTNPNNYTFDPSYNYAPIQGAKAFAGIRWTMK
jgi:outer membrane receptor for ferrienterochelin and colicins